MRTGKRPASKPTNKKLTRAQLYPPLYGQLNRVRDAATIKALDDCVARSGRKRSEIVSECVRLALPLILSGRAAVMKG